VITVTFILSWCNLVAGVAVATERPWRVDADAIRTDSFTRLTLINV